MEIIKLSMMYTSLKDNLNVGYCIFLTGLSKQGD